jgi:aspartate kinase
MPNLAPSSILVMKFGGASLKDATSIQQAVSLIETYTSEPLVIVVSAMGKMTQALEDLALAAKMGRKQEAQERLYQIHHFHQSHAQQLFPDSLAPVHERIAIYLNEISSIIEGLLLLGEFPDRIYDRIVAFGELLSSQLVFSWLEKNNPAWKWVDARDLILTDDQSRQAQVLWQPTQDQIRKTITPFLQQGHSVITQGFIGRSASGKTTTLGKEGSDYSAALFSAALGAKEQIVWKDVPGVMSEDPRISAQAEVLPVIRYDQAITMTRFGASVIHPKTIQPLRNEGIPLRVKCFLKPELPGTLISEQGPDHLPWSLLKNGLTLLELRTKDYGYLESENINRFLQSFQNAGLQELVMWVSGLDLCLITEATPAQCKMYLSSIEAWANGNATYSIALRTFSASHRLPPEPENKIYALNLGEITHWVYRLEETEISTTSKIA